MYEQAHTEFGQFLTVLRELVFDAGAHGAGEAFDDELVTELLRPLGAHRLTVELVEGDLSLPEAVVYARGLSELGLAAQADEVLGAVVAALQPGDMPQWFAVELAPFTAAA